MQSTDQVILKNIAANVAKARGKRSLYWLAKEAQTYPSNISKIEQGKHMPGAGLLHRLSLALNVATDDLLASPRSKRQPAATNRNI